MNNVELINQVVTNTKPMIELMQILAIVFMLGAFSLLIKE